MYWPSKYTTAAYAMGLILTLFPNVVDEVPRLGSRPINTEDFTGFSSKLLLSIQEKGRYKKPAVNSRKTLYQYFTGVVTGNYVALCRNHWLHCGSYDLKQ